MKTNESIEELLKAPEGEHYEFKEAKNKFEFHTALKYCCALANCGGGKFVLGVSDKRPRQVVGSNAFAQPERTRNGLMEKLLVRVDFQLYNHNGKRVLVFEIASRPIGLPVQVDGVTWSRKGDSLVPMSSKEMQRIFIEGGKDFSDEICKGATIKDLDKNAVEAFRKQWIFKTGNKTLKNLSTEQLMIDCGAIIKNEITYAALVLFGSNNALRKYLPQAEIIFEYRSKNSAGPAQQRVEFTIGFFACFDAIWDLVNLRNDKQHYQDGLFVLDVPTFNERVIREALLNAVSHRNYQMSGSIFVRQYRDRLTVENPGGFPSGVTIDNILNIQSPRNRRIASILALCGLVERAGQGMNLIYELSIKDAKPLPDFSGTDDYFVFLTLNGIINDERLLLMLKKINIEQLESMIIADLLIINSLFHEQKISKQILGFKNIQVNINKLIDWGIIEVAGRKKYVLARSLYESTGKSGIHTRLVGLDKETNKELLLKHIKSNAKKGTPFMELQQVLPSLSRKQIQVLVSELKNEKKVKLIGERKNALWFIE
ncbi:MAG: putative DNA binding domain-containing protein [Treponema sp.]|nr:putative DNA binding domain-containing protein [Treponema sp.]